VRLDRPIARRTLFRAAGLSAGWFTISRLRLPAALAETSSGFAEQKSLRALSATDARILGAIADRITFTVDPSMPRFADTPGLTTIDTALLQLPRDTVTQLHYALLLFEYGPPLFAWRLSIFTNLSDEAKDRYLEGWEQSDSDLRRLAFRAVKNLALLGYYAQDSTWPGIHYQGPWVPRPRRLVTGAGDS